MKMKKTQSAKRNHLVYAHQVSEYDQELIPQSQNHSTVKKRNKTLITNLNMTAKRQLQ